MPDSENFLNQTFATEQFVALTLLRRGGPRRVRARLLRPSTAPPWAAVMARDLTPLIPERARGGGGGGEGGEKKR